MTDDRGVSESLGFILSFAVLVTAVALTYTVGFGAITEIQQDEQVNNAERAMFALSENFDAIRRGQGPAREGELRLAGGSLEIRDTLELRVQLGNTSIDRRFEPQALVYTTDESAVTLASGGVFRRTGDGSLVVRPPPFRCGPDAAVLSLVTVEGTGNRTGVSGSDSVLVTARRASTDSGLWFPDGGTTADQATSVSITVDASPNRAAWLTALAGRGWSISGDTATCTTDAVWIRITSLQVAYIR